MMKDDSKVILNMSLSWFPVAVVLVAAASAIMARNAVAFRSLNQGIGSGLLLGLAVWMFRTLAQSKVLGKTVLSKFANGFLGSAGLIFCYGTYIYIFRVSKIYGIVPREHAYEIWITSLVLLIIGIAIKFLSFLADEPKRQSELNKRSNNGPELTGAPPAADHPETHP